MSETLRTQLKALAVKIETASGTDVFGGSGGVAAADYVAGTFDVAMPQDLSENPEVNGAMETIAPIAGGIRPTVTIRVPLRGTAAPGAAPEWGKLLRACSYSETVQAAVAATAATAGTTTSLTLAAPYVGTSQFYRGMPLVLAGDRALATLIQDYSAARVATLMETMGTAGTVTTTAALPACVIYRPTSDESLFRTVTVYAWIDGLRHRIVGCSGTWSLEMAAGKVAMLVFELRGILLDGYVLDPMPTGWAAQRTTPPLWLNGKSQLNRSVARTDRARYSAGVSLADVENPESPQGFDAPLPVARQGALEVAPFATTTQSPTRFSGFQAGATVPYGAIVGAAAGNRCGFLLPNARVTKFDMGDRNSLGVDNVTLTPDGADLSASIVVF